MKALIVVDLQNDFIPGGALAVDGGDLIIPVVDQLLKQPFDVKVATKDWHPRDHGSFAKTHGKGCGEHIQLHGIDQILWPIHCVQGSYGAEFADGWDAGLVEKIVYKGLEKDIDSYSTFFDNEHLRATGLEAFLKSKNVTDVYLAGLATDYCVKYSALDALKLGFKVYVITDACRGVDLKSGDSQKALYEMQTKGAHLIESKDLPNWNDSSTKQPSA